MKIKKVIKMLIKQGPFAVLRAIRDHYRKKREEEKFRNRVRSLHLIRMVSGKIKKTGNFWHRYHLVLLHHCIIHQRII